MQSVKPETVTGQPVIIPSRTLNRVVPVDLYLPPFSKPGPMHVLLINDGQDLACMQFESMLEQLYCTGSLQPLLCIGIHAGPLRKLEYGTASGADYRSRGVLASRYTRSVSYTHLTLPTIYSV